MRCIRCMHTIEKTGTCPHCGLKEREYHAMQYVLPVRTVLQNRYMTGVVTEEDENSITYQGWDMQKKNRVLICEYFPRRYAARSRDGQIEPYYEKENIFEERKKRCMERVKELGAVCPLDNLILPNHAIQENNTVYMIMPYTELETLDAFWDRTDRRMTEEEFFEAAKPLMKDLCRMHEEGIAHLSIHPGKLGFIRKEKMWYCFRPDRKQLQKVRQAMAAEKLVLSMTAIVEEQVSPKYEAYAPLECYHDITERDTRADVYGICAAAYRAITGMEPVKAYERLVYGKQNKSFAEYGINVSREREQVIQKGLEIFHKNRWFGLWECYNRLYQDYNGVTAQSKAGQIHRLVETIKAYNRQENETAERYQKWYQDAEDLYFGTGPTGKRNLAVAFEYYKKAAEGGSADAKCCLGVCYYLGEGTITDQAKARKWLREAAEAGNKAARTTLYLWYRNSLDPLQEKTFELRKEQIERIQKLCEKFAAGNPEWKSKNMKLFQKLGVKGEQIFLSYEAKINGWGFVITDKRAGAFSYEQLAKTSTMRNTAHGVAAGDQMIAFCHHSQDGRLLQLFKDIRHVLLCP